MTLTLPGRTGPRGLVVLAAAAVLCPAQPASAQGSPPPPLPGEAAVDQYREALPTGGGPFVPTPGTRRVTPLPAAVGARLTAEGGADTSLLEKVATSSDYGAPERGAPSLRVPDTRGRPSGDALPDASLTRGLGAAAGALGEDGNGRLLALLTVMLAIGAGVATVSRRAARAG